MLYKFATYLKMIGKGFVLFKINSSQSAFYIIKPTCISWLVLKWAIILKIVENCKPGGLLTLPSDDVMSGQNENTQFCVLAVALNLIFGMLSAQFKFNNNVERWNWQSWFIYVWVKAAAGL